MLILKSVRVEHGDFTMACSDFVLEPVRKMDRKSRVIEDGSEMIQGKKDN